MVWWALHIWSATLISPFWLLFQLTVPGRKRREVAGIVLTQLSWRPGRDLTIVAERALTLIQEVDSRRFHRIQREIVIVLGLRLPSRGRYQRLGRACLIDVDNYRYSSEESLVRQVACTLIHESVHGHLERLRYPYLGSTKERHEDLAETEVLRFIEKWRQTRKEDEHSVAQTKG